MRAREFGAWLLDLDGVLYIGDQVLPGVHEALRRLRDSGIALRFLTNDPRPTREQLVERLRRLGIEASVEEVITCGYATARLLTTLGIRTAFVVGSTGLAEELERAGIAVLREGLPEAVVVGADEELRFLDVAHGAVLVQRGARFVATNADPSYPLPVGVVPATGAVVSAIQLASGRRPLVVGKPEPHMFRLALQTLPPETPALVVGDRVDSDVLGAHRAGLPAILVAAESPVFRSRRDLRRPDAVVSSLLEAVERSPELPERLAVPSLWPERVVAGVVLLLLDSSAERLAVVRAGGMVTLPWTALEPLETFDEAAQRLLDALVGNGGGLECETKHLGAIGREPWVVVDAEGAVLQLAGQAFLARCSWQDPARTSEWIDLAALEDALPEEQAAWCRQVLVAAV